MNNEPDYDNLYFERKPMTQRIFDVENEKDMALLWSILPIEISLIRLEVFPADDNYYEYIGCCSDGRKIGEIPFIKINWHNKTEITRPVQEATEADIGKLCYFWDYDEQKESGTGSFGKLCIINEHKVKGTKYQGQNIGWFPHCRRLTKKEIEELC